MAVPPHVPPDLAELAEEGSPEELLVRRIDFQRLPRHVAVIMDGNGRWAKERGLPRVEGHRSGVRSVREVVETAARMGIEVLTLYAFSVENWKRPRVEVWTLMNLLKEYVRRELDAMVENGIRCVPIGRWRELDPSVVAELERAVEATAGGTRMTLEIALNYSGRCEIVDACRKIVADWAAGKGTDTDEETIGEYHYPAGQPDPDHFNRTSGEMRNSNFLLWQIAYTEIWVTETLWPDFGRRELYRAVIDYQGRDRRYGGVRDEAPAEAGTTGVAGSLGPTG
jgi:undecaprenyl diphosphate synthase